MVAMTAPASQRRTLLALALTQVFGTIGLGVAPTIGILLASEMTHSQALAGVARTASTFGAALFGIPLANLAARTSRRCALSVGWLVASLGAALLAFSAGGAYLTPVILGMLMIGAGSAASYQARFAATDQASESQRTSALSFIVWVGTIGSVLGPNIGTPARLLSERWGTNLYGTAFGLAALALCLATAMAYLFLPAPSLTSNVTDPPGVSPHRPSFGARCAAVYRHIVGNAQARCAVLALLGAHTVMVSVMTMTPVHMNHQGASIEVIGLTISLHVLGMFGLSPLMGIAADRFGQRPVIMAGLMTLVLSLELAIVAPENQPVMVLSLTLLGLGWSAVFVAGSALFAASLPQKQRVEASGGLDALMNLGAAMAALASGLVLAAASFPVLAGLAGLLLAPGAIGLWASRR